MNDKTTGMQEEKPTISEEDYLRVIKAFKFYGVRTEGQLILAQAKHIERLQEKLIEAQRRLNPTIQYRTHVREG